jgi:predicted nucleic acid-binding protein
VTADTSVLVAAFASWHEAHEASAAAVRSVEVLIGHVVLETYAVLTRLPGGHRADPALVATFLSQFGGRAPLVLPGSLVSALPGRLASAGVDGGATYDALVGATAAHHDAVLLTRDRRAIRTYDALGVRHAVV